LLGFEISLSEKKKAMMNTSKIYQREEIEECHILFT